jgi:AcrR family transcriptional regulator
VRSSEGQGNRRADALANRDALLRAARALYAERGRDVPIEEIAHAAGVGRATLYRHFPTRERLHIAVLDRFVEDVELVAAGLPAAPAAFFTLFQAALRLQTDNLPLVELLPPTISQSPAVSALRARMRAVFEQPLAAAQAAGVVRAELSPEDVRIQLVMLGAVVRPDTAKADQRRAWRLAQAALGISS